MHTLRLQVSYCDVTAYFPVLFYKLRNGKWTPACVYIIKCKQSNAFGKIESTYETLANGSDLRKLSNFPKLFLVFA